MTFLFREREELSTVFLRFGLGSVFLWFGVDKWIRPEAWYAWIPDWLWAMQPFSPELVMQGFGLAEFALGVALVWGKKVRASAIAASLILIAVILVAGGTQSAVRDVALLGIALALFAEEDLHSEKPWVSRHVRWLVAGYVTAMFLVGIYYLRA